MDIKIIGFVAEVTSSLLYTNSEDSPIEAEFTFPVDDSSAVFKFEAEIEGRHIVAEIQEKELVSITYCREIHETEQVDIIYCDRDTRKRTSRYLHGITHPGFCKSW